MSFTLSNSFVQKIRAMSPFKPITVYVRWFDDDKGVRAQLNVVHVLPSNHPYRKFTADKKLSLLTTIMPTTTNSDVLSSLRSQMLQWHKMKNSVKRKR